MQSIDDNPTPWWLWPTVLSLDAPAVAVSWQELIAASAGTRPTSPERAVLGLSVWLAYAADRWIEGWRLDPRQVRTNRHRFYQKWRWPVAVLWVLALAADVWLAASGLSLRAFEAGLVLLACVAAYLLSHQLIHRTVRWRVPKEACVAVIIAGGSSLFVFFHAARPPADVAADALVFCALCFVNCCLISAWENEVDEAHGQTSLAHQLGSDRLLHALPWAVAAATAVAWAIDRHAPRALLGAALLSALLLGATDLAHRRVGRRAARVLADACLALPAALFVAWPWT